MLLLLIIYFYFISSSCSQHLLWGDEGRGESSCLLGLHCIHSFLFTRLGTAVSPGGPSFTRRLCTTEHHPSSQMYHHAAAVTVNKKVGIVDWWLKMVNSSLAFKFVVAPILVSVMCATVVLVNKKMLPVATTQSSIAPVVSSAGAEDSELNTPDQTNSALASKSTVNTTYGDNIALFLEWLANNGVNTSLCEFGEVPEGRGLKASVDIPDGIEVISIPSYLYLSTERALQSPIGDILRAFMSLPGAVNYGQTVAIYLVYEFLKGDDSFFAPWFRVMPDLQELPVNWRCV